MRDCSSLPLLARLEWHLSQWGPLALAIDYFVHKPRVKWRHFMWRCRRHPAALTRFETRRYCQNGEDGIIAEIFRRIGHGNRFAVEFGVADGTECCTRDLLANYGWHGLLIEGSVGHADKARTVYAGLPVTVVQSLLTTDNILDVFRLNEVPTEPDLLVVDVDGNDYWLLNRILSVYRPRVIVAEYNGWWVPPREWVMDYSPTKGWNWDMDFGASLASIAKLTAAFGYTLVGCDSMGVNAFFVRSDLLGESFPDHAFGVAHHYAPPRYGRGYGHPVHGRRPTARQVAKHLTTTSAALAATPSGKEIPPT